MRPFGHRSSYGEIEDTNSRQNELPPIRQMFPEINEPLLYEEAGENSQAREQQEPQEARERGSFSYYITSPTSERRRAQDEAESSSSHVPRVYRDPRHRVPRTRQLSPSLRTSERWAAPPRASPGTNRSIPSPMEMQISSPGPRVALPILNRPQVTLPSLKSALHFENEQPSRPRGPSRAYSHDYAMHQQPRSPLQPPERTPFSSSVFSTPGHLDAAHYGDMDMDMDMDPDSAEARRRPRKRRGNLPKQATDKMRAWFDDHLSHPYPTEDEKQDFIRRTGLQMNQISNWFINARRRHLPEAKRKAADEKAALDGLQNGQANPSSDFSFAASPATSDGTLFSATSDGTFSAASDGTTFSNVANYEKRGSV